MGRENDVEIELYYVRYTYFTYEFHSCFFFHAFWFTTSFQTPTSASYLCIVLHLLIIHINSTETDYQRKKIYFSHPPLLPTSLQVLHFIYDREKNRKNNEITNKPRNLFHLFKIDRCTLK